MKVCVVKSLFSGIVEVYADWDLAVDTIIDRNERDGYEQKWIDVHTEKVGDEFIERVDYLYFEKHNNECDSREYYFTMTDVIGFID